MEQLEGWREEHGLSKSDMARRLGAPAPQYYTNWLARDSLPKAYIDAANKLLGKFSPVKTEPGYEDSAFAMLSAREKRELVLRLLPDLDKESRLAALRYLLDK